MQRPDGPRLHIRAWGESPAGCVLIHGLAEGAYVWEAFAEQLSAHCSVFAVDLRGHGESQWDSAKRYRLDDHVADLAAVLQTLDLTRIILVGHSLGGDIVARLTALAPALRGVVLVDAGPGGDREAAQVVHSQILDSYRPYRSIDEYAAWLAERRFLAAPETLACLAAHALRPREGGGFELKFDPLVADVLRETHDDSWWIPMLRSVTAPTLIVRGMGSAVLPRATAELMLGALPRGSLAVVPEAGHAVVNDNPVGFAAAAGPFVINALRPSA